MAPRRGPGPLPDGFRLALDPGARWAGSDLLIGGSPIRLLRLTPAGREVVDRVANGETVPASPAAQNLARRLLDAGLAHPRPPNTARTVGAVIVIPVHDDAGGLAGTLAALAGAPAGESGTEPVCVVVVDDASADRGGLQAVCSQAGITLLHRRIQGGPAAARNDGWQAANQPFVAFVDANCQPEPNWLHALLPHFADPQVAAVAPRIVPVAGPEVPRWLAAYEAVCSPLDLGAGEANVRPHGPVAYVPTAALVVRRAALEHLGGFDEGLRVGEDVDFVWRLVNAGWTVRYEPRAAVRHPVRANASAWLRQRYRYGTSAAPLARRHGAAVAPAAVSPWTAAAWSFVAAGRPLAGAAAAGYSTIALTATVPAPHAVRLAGLGHVRGGLALARAVRRAWPPPAAILALASKRSRPAIVASAVVPGVADWVQRRPRLDPLRFVALRLADDLAYAAGVWAGCVRERSLRAVRPDLRIARRGRARQTEDPVGAIGGRR